MDILIGVSGWVTERESLLSGLAALIVLSGVVLSPVGVGLGRVARNRGRRAQEAAIPAARTTQRLTLTDLTRPSPYETRFALSTGTRIAYNVRGEGPLTIVYVPGLISHIHLLHNLPATRSNLDALSAFARLILLDKRGQGQSEAALRLTNEEHVRDIGAVMDAEGVDRAVLISFSEGGALCVEFAHAHRERVAGLVLVGSSPRWVFGEDYPIGVSRSKIESIPRVWGTGAMRESMLPSLSREVIDDETYRQMERVVGNRHTMHQIANMMIETDVRRILPEIDAPALVIHFSGDISVPIQHGRAFADGLANAEFLEVASADHGNLGASPDALARVRAFCERVGAPSALLPRG